MGRPRKPAKLHAIEGTTRARLLARVNELDIEATGVGECPAWFDADAREVWERITTHSQYSKVLNPLEREPLITYCALWAKRVKGLRGDEGAPKMTTMDVQVLNSLTQQFGFTPAAQAKVNLPAKKTEGRFDKFKTA